MKALHLNSYILAVIFSVGVGFAQNTAVISSLGKTNDTAATGEWWKKKFAGEKAWMDLNVAREKVIGFALYTTHDNILKLTAQFYPLLPEEPRTATLEINRDGSWELVSEAKIHELGWSAHFRVKDWDQSKDANYRIKHNNKATYTGLVRKDPIDKKTITVAGLSCNSKKDRGDRESIVNNLLQIDPDLLYFAGDQSYDHKEHTAAWLQFGRQFGELMRNRPTVTIPDDHDVGQPNLWGEGGKVSTLWGSSDGGYTLPAEYVKMVERCQTWHLPDAYDPSPVQQSIGVYYTDLTLGEISFAILEDRKWKSGPAGKIPKQGPRPDHIKNPKYDPKSIDIDGLVLLGERQHKFLHQWAQDWTGAEMKAVLSQTPFAGAATHHGGIKNKLHADMDSNGWPQTQRNIALQHIRRAWAPHISGDQHLGLTFQHGIETWNDGPYCISSPAIVNTIYSRYWRPGNEGNNRNPKDLLPHTGEYLDGFANKITMMAYANPNRDANRGSGYSVIYFDKNKRQITFENWPANANRKEGDKPYPGWPITIDQQDNDGRAQTGTLGAITVEGTDQPVFQVIAEDTKEILYTIRSMNSTFSPPVYSDRNFTVKIGKELPNLKALEGRTIKSEAITISLP